MQEVIRINESRDDAGNGLTKSSPLIAIPSQGELGVRVRDAVPGDLSFIDALQKKHSKAVGWMPTGQLEGHIAKGHVVVAEATSGLEACGLGDEEKNPADACKPQDSGHKPSRAFPVGYCIGVDKYFKREEAGIIYQMNIEPGSQRGLLGATLLQAMFDRWPYGVQLCCCWCAQDLQANYFWEAMGFVPLAFRSGSKKKDRIHIFWQKQIRKTAEGQGKQSGAWWFPSQTGGGALREDRIVLPIPPGTHWSDAKPRIFPEVSGLIESAAAERKALEAPAREAERARKREQKAAAKAKAEEAAAQAETVAAGGLRFGAVGQGTGGGDQGSDAKGKKAEAKSTKQAPKNDPRLVAAARELRDRWLEHAAANPGLIEQGNTAARRYDVGRQIDQTRSPMPPELTPELAPEFAPELSAQSPPQESFPQNVLPQRTRSANDAA